MEGVFFKRSTLLGMKPTVPGDSSALGIISERLTRALAERFTLLQRLADEEDAEYYLAGAVGDGRLVELKVLTEEAAHNPKKCELFYLEAEAAARLLHPNILAVSQAEQLGNVCFSVGEHRPQAKTLRAVLDANGWLDLERAIEIGSHIAEALGQAHELDVLHLNLHPGAVLIEPDGRAIVSRFGIAMGRQREWAHRERTRRMPAGYLSIEQVQGESLDHLSDIYSLGAVLYELLTDRAPFDSDNSDYTRQMRTKRVPAAPHQFCPTVPEAVSDVVMKMLEINRERRLQNAAMIRAALRAAMDAAERRPRPVAWSRFSVTPKQPKG